MNTPRHDADLGLTGRNDAGAVRADQSRLGGFELGPNLDHIESRNAFGDADDERNPRVFCFENGVGGKGRRNENHGRIGAGCGNGIGHRVENRPAFMRGSVLAGSYAANNIGAVLGAAFGVKGSILPVNP